jgi:hypothetical protein
MKRIYFLLVAVAVAVAVAASGVAFTSPVIGHADHEAAPIYGVQIPSGYRDWTMISIAQVGAPVKDLRVNTDLDL